MNDYVNISLLSFPFHVKGGASWQHGPTFTSQRWGHGPGAPPPCGRQCAPSHEPGVTRGHSSTGGLPTLPLADPPWRLSLIPTVWDATLLDLIQGNRCAISKLLRLGRPYHDSFYPVSILDHLLSRNIRVLLAADSQTLIWWTPSYRPQHEDAGSNVNRSRGERGQK